MLFIIALFYLYTFTTYSSLDGTEFPAALSGLVVNAQEETGGDSEEVEELPPDNLSSEYGTAGYDFMTD